MFSDLTWKISIGKFLIVYICIQCFIIYVLSLFFLCMFNIFENPVYAFGSAGVLGVVEYVAYCFIDNSSVINVFKYINIFYVVLGTGIFSEYRNIAIASYAVGKNLCLFVVAMVLLLCLCLMGVLNGRYKYPVASMKKGGGVLKRVRQRIYNIYYQYEEKVSVFRVEHNKIFVCQKGYLLLFVLLFLGIYNTDFTKVELSGVQERVVEFMEKYEGVPSEASQKEIERLSKKVQKVEKEYQRAALQYEKGKIEEKEYIRIAMKYDSFAEDREVMDELQKQTNYLKELKQKRNIDGWYMNTYGYSHLLDVKEKSNLYTLLYSFGIVFLCSGIFAFEKKSGMKELLRSTQKGRKFLFQKKLKNIFSVAFGVFLIMSVVELTNVAVVYGLTGFKAPVQSIHFLSFLPFSCNIGVFLLILYTYKFAMLLAIACFTSLLSMVFSQKTALSLSGILYIPSLLYLAGIDDLASFSITSVIGVMPTLLDTKNIWLTGAVCMVFAFVGVVSVVVMGKKWCQTNKKSILDRGVIA